MVVVAAIIHNYSLRFSRSVNLMNTFDRMGNAEEMNSHAGRSGERHPRVRCSLCVQICLPSNFQTVQFPTSLMAIIRMSGLGEGKNDCHVFVSWQCLLLLILSARALDLQGQYERGEWQLLYYLLEIIVLHQELIIASEIWLSDERLIYGKACLRNFLQ